ncbi:hypothetical protein ATANTOWER_029567 [Ataeniobius toweri]|uniref:Uncharacterized protein n=1 Tax=Ataeniobius toweri TaxID=208326 RepID=A0ABU7BV88_9TELE|nr:hypothetical protein [Ataeniobius toweri]
MKHIYILVFQGKLPECDAFELHVRKMQSSDIMKTKQSYPQLPSSTAETQLNIEQLSKVKSISLTHFHMGLLHFYIQHPILEDNCETNNMHSLFCPTAPEFISYTPPQTQQTRHRRFSFVSGF